MENQRIPLVVLSGHLTCETPLSFQLPGLGSKDRHVLPSINTAKGKCLYINAPSIRSAVRHAATMLIHELTGNPFRMDDYFLLALGGIKNAGSDSDAEEERGEGGEANLSTKEKSARAHTLKFDFAREKNPLLMLFGSMDVPGLVECSHAVSPAGVTAQWFGGVRANDFQRNPGIMDILAPGAIDDFVRRQVEAAARSDIKSARKDLRNQIREAQQKKDAELVAELRAKDKALDTEEKKNTVVSLALPNLGYEAIPAGTQLEHEWAIKRVSEVELALFLQSLALWALDPKIGGHKNHGLGKLSGSWNVTARRPGTTRMEAIGTLEFSGYDGIQPTGEVARYLDPQILRDAIGSCDFSYASLAALK